MACGKNEGLHICDAWFVAKSNAVLVAHAAVPMQVKTMLSGEYPIAVYAFPFLHAYIRKPHLK